jgi:2-phosphosulfolactate phosphatase
MFQVHLLPRLVPPGALSGGFAVVLDVLRATTVMVQALASGCASIIPCIEIEDAKRIAQDLPAGTSFLGGERHGVPIEGFDLGNSPGDYTPESCGGKTLVMTTTNGTKAILSCLDADRVVVASFGNAAATARELVRAAETGQPIHIVCAGTEGEISLEDTLLAGHLGLLLASRDSRLQHWREASVTLNCNDQALLACASAWELLAFGAQQGERTALASILSQGRGGRRVTELDLVPDILAAAGLDTHQLVAELARDPIRILRSA